MKAVFFLKVRNAQRCLQFPEFKQILLIVYKKVSKWKNKAVLSSKYKKKRKPISFDYNYMFIIYFSF